MYPKGSYLNSSKNLKIYDNILSCELRAIDGTYIINEKYVDLNVLYHNFNGVLTPDNYTNSYFIKLGSEQLGNCLRIIISGIIIANNLKMNVFIINNPLLREKEKKVISHFFRQYLINGNNSIDYVKLNYDNSVKYDKFYGTNYDLICEGIFTPPTNVDKFGITYSIYSIIPENMSHDLYIINKIKIYKSLRLPPILEENIKSFIDKNNLNNCIGVHIRYTDNLKDRCKIHNNFITPYDIFINKINSIDQNMNLLVCSDSNLILDKLRLRNNIIFADKCFNNNFQGLYEMYLLANCKYIIGSNSSTFSYESAFINGTNIELYENNNWKMYELEKYRDK